MSEIGVTYGLSSGLAAPADIEKSEGGAKVASLNVSQLCYEPSRDLISIARQACISKVGFLKFLPSKSVFRDDVSPLHNVTFAARGGKVTGIVGSHISEQRTLLDLLSGRRKTGKYSGDIYLTGTTPGVSYIDSMAYVSQKTPYIPGLTYLDTLTYSARLRLAGTEVKVEERVQEVMDIMDLSRCKNRVVPEFPSMKGEDGRDMRLLSIAMEIMMLPPLIVVNDPVLLLDAGVACKIMEALHRLAEKGHIVICSFPKPNPILNVFLDDIVVLSEGYSIFASAISNIVPFFCSREMNYLLRKGVDIVDFAIDISSGTERAESQRVAELPHMLQEQFESSTYFQNVDKSNTAISLFTSELTAFFGYGKVDSFKVMVSRFLTIIERAVFSKFKDADALRRITGTSTVAGLFVGYLQYNQGDYGYYTINLVSIPYLNTANVTATLFFSSAFIFIQQVLNVHVICQKLQVFRYEQASGCCTALPFCVATIFSEVPFTIFFGWILSSIIYFMTDMAKGYYNYFFFVFVMCETAIVGLVSALLFASIIRKEIAVRDTFFFCTFLMLLLSGFAFQLKNITSYMTNIAVINPMRWAFEALMNWKFTDNYHDGINYLQAYSFNTFSHEHVFRILANFIIFSACLFFLTSLSPPMLLSKLPASAPKEKRSDSRDSMGSNDSFDDNHSARSSRASEAVKPVIYARESSITQKSRLSVNVSQYGEESDTRGPTVYCREVTYRVRDSGSPLGYKVVLNNVSAQFDWGKLSMVLGAAKSGKTSLLHILAGDVSPMSDLTGEILHNKHHIDGSVPLWKRCALVDAVDEQYRDLTVHQVISFAMKLRCANFKGLEVVEENVKRTVEILHLEDCLAKKVKHIRAGERRRLSIAEELVAGPYLLLVDEPVAHLDPQDESEILMTFRELVNQDRTVIASMTQPSANVFKMFDTVILLSKGRVIFHGAASHATKFFIESPYKYDISKYSNNPGEFLMDISGGLIADASNNIIECSMLENYYHKTDLYNNLVTRINKVIASASLTNSTSSTSNNTNPMQAKSIEPASDSDVKRNHTSDSIELESGDESRPVTFSETPMSVRFFKVNIAPFFVWKKDDFETFALKCMVLFHREAMGLTNRWELLLGSCVVHIILGALFGWVIGDASKAVYNATSFFAVGTLFLLLCNVQFVYYLFRYNLVFLKEHSRGLYSNFMQWAVCGWPLYFLRAVNAILYSLVTYSMMNLYSSTEIQGFFIAINIVAVLASAIMSEAIVNGVTNLRNAYYTIPALTFLQFTFSGLFVKSATLPSWLAPWMPSVSIIRWSMQGNFINQYETTNIIPSLPLYSFYTAFLNLFGWGGKTKWFCFFSLFIFIAVFKVLAFIASGLATLTHRGGQRYKEVIA